MDAALPLDLPARVPEVVAHRGASAEAPEHTLAAYRRALDYGADAVEADVRLTADGHLVCVHDRRVNRTSSGRGLVSTSTLAELNRLDFGSWHAAQRWAGDEDAPVVDEDRHRVLTLDDLLRLILQAPRPVGLALETKHPTRYGGFVERAVVEALQRFGLARPPRDGSSRVRVMSFSQVALRRMRQLAPGVPTVLLLERVPVRFRDGSLPLGVRIAGPSVEVLRQHPRYVERVHAHGARVHVWTVDDPADVDLCRSLGVDAIITNRPLQVLRQLGRAVPAADGSAVAPGGAAEPGPPPA